MSFPLALASALTGASPNQLRGWKNREVLVPEDSAENPMLYSFRDLVALRSIVYLRALTSNQRITKAMRTLRHDYDLTDHPSQYTFATDGRNVEVLVGDEAFELVQSKGQRSLVPLVTVFRPFQDWRGRPVVDFERPRPNLQVVNGRLGGWPTIADTRVPYDTIADLLRDDDMTADQIRHFYPTVSTAAANDAADFDAQVRSIGQVSA